MVIVKNVDNGYLIITTDDLDNNKVVNTSVIQTIDNSMKDVRDLINLILFELGVDNSNNNYIIKISLVKNKRE